MELKEIREELKDIRYYYSRKQVFDDAVSFSCNTVLDIVKKYNDAMRFAPPILFDVYISLYVHNNTQESAAVELNFSFIYLQQLNKKLLQFLQKQIKE